MRGGRRPVTAASADLDLCAERARCVSVSAALAEYRVCDPTEITESTQLPCPLVCGRAAAGNFHKCEVRLVFGPPPPPVFRGFFWADLAWLFSIRVETKLWDLKRPASFRKQARTGFESMFRSCELYTTIDSPAIPPTPHVRGHERTGHERHTIEGFSLGGLKGTDMRPGCRFKAIC